MRRFQTRAIALSFGAGGELPTEFRLFVRGLNKTENGDFLFDDQAAASVMAAYEAWGVEVMIDLEHQMLGPAGADPNARDARGWCKLALRNGELWAVDVRWTDDGAARLAQKRQRYVSPAFEIDPKTKRVTKLINVAITALPATHHTPALVAASAGGSMDPKIVKEALDALMAGDAEKCMELLKGAIAAAAGASMEEPAAPEVDASAAPAAAPMAEEKKPEEEKAMAAASLAAATTIVRLSGKGTLVEALSEIEAWRESHVSLAGERAKLAKEREALEAADRRKLCVELITLGAEFPATVWADDNGSELKDEWKAIPLSALRTRVEAQRAARKGKQPTAIPAPRGAGAQAPAGDVEMDTPHGRVTLSAREVAVCKEVGADLKVYAANKAITTAANAGR